MINKKKREWSYLGMLGVSILLFLTFWKLGWVSLDDPASGTRAHFRDGFMQIKSPEWLSEWMGGEGPAEESPAEDPPLEDLPSKPPLQEEVPPEGFLTEGDSTEGLPDGLPDETPDGGSWQEEVKEEEPFKADTTYFDDALFIGDSRTVGLAEYGNLGQAEVLADSGMSVYKVMKTEFTTGSGRKLRLTDLLEEREFGKIYIMLGINELGYDFDQTVKKYGQMLTDIRSLQPHALIYLQANLHITSEKSETSTYYNNDNINRFNRAVEEMADGKEVFYLDVNGLFDDETGGLDEQYTSDHTHILGKHYLSWVDWLLSQAVRPPERSGDAGHERID